MDRPRDPRDPDQRQVEQAEAHRPAVRHRAGPGRMALLPAVKGAGDRRQRLAGSGSTPAIAASAAM